MRIVGIVLVILGALALGYGGFSYVTPVKLADAGVEVTAERKKTVRIPPVVAGIAVVGGLILLATTCREETA